MANRRQTAIPAADWYESIPFADGITLIHEPWMTPFFRCNMWLVRGSERSLLIDAGLGAVSLRQNVPLLGEGPVTLLLSHTHFDHIGSAFEFAERLAHPIEAPILEAPGNEATLFSHYAGGGADDEMFITPPQGWSAPDYRIPPAPATGLVEEGDVIDLGNRQLTVLHTPGHSPGHVSLFEEKTGILIAADVIYDGPLVTDCYHSDMGDYVASLKRLRELQPAIIHGGHFPSFGPVRYRQIIDEFLDAAGAR